MCFGKIVVLPATSEDGNVSQVIHLNLKFNWIW
jgi:hypothetical protein